MILTAEEELDILRRHRDHLHAALNRDLFRRRLQTFFEHWSSRKPWGQSTEERWSKLQEESAELHAALRGRGGDVKLEAGQCLLVLMSIAEKSRFDLVDAGLEAFEEAKKKYGE